MNQAFSVRVTDKNGNVKEKVAVIGGGPNYSAEDLAGHYHRFDMFPGAKEILISESDVPAPATIEEAIKRGGTGRKAVFRQREHSTPMPKIGKPIKLADKLGAEEEATHAGGDGIDAMPGEVNNPHADAK